MTQLAELFPAKFYIDCDPESLRFGTDIQYYNVIVPRRRQEARVKLVQKKEREGVLAREDEKLLRAIDFADPPAGSGLRRVPEIAAPLFAEYELRVEEMDRGECWHRVSPPLAAMIRQESAYVRTGTAGSEVDQTFRLNMGRLSWNNGYRFGSRGTYPYLVR